MASGGATRGAAAAARELVVRFESTDVRGWALNETVRRAQTAVLLAGGTLLGGPGSRRPRRRRWCVLRSPHIDKRSREHFHMVTHFRHFRYALPVAAPPDLPAAIVRALPANVATRLQDSAPGLLALPAIFATLQRSTASPRPDDPEPEQEHPKEHPQVE